MKQRGRGLCVDLCKRRERAPGLVLRCLRFCGVACASVVGGTRAAGRRASSSSGVLQSAPQHTQRTRTYPYSSPICSYRHQPHRDEQTIDPAERRPSLTRVTLRSALSLRLRPYEPREPPTTWPPQVRAVGCGGPRVAARAAAAPRPRGARPRAPPPPRPVRRRPARPAPPPSRAVAPLRRP